MATFTPLDEAAPLDRRALSARPHHVPLGIVIDKTCRVYIANIPVERIERDGATALRSEFECFGPVESYRLFTERSGRFLGTALCTYRNPADAALAVASMHGRVIDSATLRVEVARDHGVVLLRRDVALPPSSSAAAAAASSAARANGDMSAQSRRRGSYNSSNSSDAESYWSRDVVGAAADDDGKWHHDRYDALQRGDNDDDDSSSSNRGDGANARYTPHRFRGRGGGRWLRGGRGRGGGNVQRARDAQIEREFERYIAERDRQLGVAVTAAPASSPSSSHEQATHDDDDGHDDNVTAGSA